MQIKVGILLGKTLVAVDYNGSDEIVFKCSDGTAYVMYHSQDCCEDVAVESIVGDLSDLVGEPILRAEEVEGETPPDPEGAESFTWTFYKFATRKGYVDIRWLGTSNGYYSESVSFTEYPRKRY